MVLKMQIKDETLKVIFIGIFVMSLLIANVVSARLIYLGELGPLTLNVPGAVLIYAITFLSTDILSERWGKKTALRAVKAGFIAQIMATALMTLTMFMPVANDPYVQSVAEAYSTMFAFNAFVVIGSLVAYYISQTLDVHLFHRFREKFLAKKWMRNSTTILSQFIDTIIFIPIAFAIPAALGLPDALPLALIPGMIVGQYLVKVVLALCDTPFFYWLTGGKYSRPEGHEE